MMDVVTLINTSYLYMMGTVTDKLGNMNPDTIEKGTEVAKKSFNFVRSLNYIAMYEWIKTNFWIPIGGVNIPILLPIAIILVILGKLMRMVKAIATITIIIALVLFFNTMIVGM